MKMTSSHTINRGVSPMTDYGRFGHTQTLSHKVVGLRHATPQAIRDCETDKGLQQSRDAEDALGSSTARLCQAVEEMEGSLGERLLLRQRRARQPYC